jgi:hypothetical protein
VCMCVCVCVCVYVCVFIYTLRACLSRVKPSLDHIILFHLVPTVHTSRASAERNHWTRCERVRAAETGGMEDMYCHTGTMLLHYSANPAPPAGPPTSINISATRWHSLGRLSRYCCMLKKEVRLLDSAHARRMLNSSESSALHVLHRMDQFKQ